jgi:hypothetical protein
MPRRGVDGKEIVSWMTIFFDEAATMLWRGLVVVSPPSPTRLVVILPSTPRPDAILPRKTLPEIRIHRQVDDWPDRLVGQPFDGLAD